MSFVYGLPYPLLDMHIYLFLYVSVYALQLISMFPFLPVKMSDTKPAKVDKKKDKKEKKEAAAPVVAKPKTEVAKPREYVKPGR